SHTYTQTHTHTHTPRVCSRCSDIHTPFPFRPIYPPTHTHTHKRRFVCHSFATLTELCRCAGFHLILRINFVSQGIVNGGLVCVGVCVCVCVCVSVCVCVCVCLCVCV